MLQAVNAVPNMQALAGSGLALFFKHQRLVLLKIKI